MRSILTNLASVSIENRYEIPEDIQIRILADVVSPLCGHQGATYTFGKQKGLHPTMFAVVDQAIQDFYEKISPATLEIKGAGAGGRHCWRFVCFCSGKYRVGN